MVNTTNTNSYAVQAALTFYDGKSQWRNQEQRANTSNLRRDPRRNSTTAIHLRGCGGGLDSTGRPLSDRRTFFLGPGPSIVGGDLRYRYPEKSTGKVKLDKSLDPREILNSYQAGNLGVAGKSAEGALSEKERSEGLGTSRPHTAPVGKGLWASAQVSSKSNPADFPKAVWHDGRQVHILEGVSPSMSTTGRPSALQSDWAPAHVQHRHIEPGACLGQVEVPGGTDTKLIGSKYRYLPNYTADPPPPRDVATASSLRLGHQSLANSVRAYALTHKTLGYKEYEARARGMEGVCAWEATGGPMSSSMRVGRPSVLMGPTQHTERLSLRPRPATTRAGW